MAAEVQQIIIEAEERLALASLNLDLAVFAELLHPNYVIVQPGGVVENKEETLASLASDTRHWQVAYSDEMVVQCGFPVQANHRSRLIAVGCVVGCAI